MERTQQRIELLEKTANFHCMRLNTIAALREQSRGALSIHISCKALSGASLEMDLGSAPLQLYLEGGIPDIKEPHPPASWCNQTSVGTKGNNRMNRLIVLAGISAVFAGCAFNPEAMPVGQRDSAVYVDEGAPKTLATNEERAKVAVISSEGPYKQFKTTAEVLDSALNAKLSGFAFFEIVDRKSQAALIKDSLAAGADPEDLPTAGVEADFVVVARIASLTVRNTGTMFSSDVVFDFKWISKATQKVIMTESIKPPMRGASSEVDLANALNRAAGLAAADFCAKIAVKYAPPARVLQTRGNGAAARISIGKNYGLAEGSKICFYEIVDNSDVGGEKRDMSDIATGVVKRVEEKTAWVAVDNAEEANVRKGVYVRVLEQTRGWGSSLLEKSGIGEAIGN